MKITDTVFGYYGGRKLLLRGGSCNAYAVAQPDGGFFLIDAGVKVLHKAKRLVRHLKKDGLSIGNLKTVLVTHAHPDHTNAISYLQELNPDVEIWVHEADAGVLEEPGTFIEHQLRVAPELTKIFIPLGAVKFVERMANFAMGKAPELHVNRRLNDGDVVGSGAGELQVIHTPGHTDGHAGYLLRAQKLLFSGDIIDPVRDHKPVLNLPTSNYAALSASLEKMAKLDIETMATAHGIPKESNIIIEGSGAVSLSIARAKEHLEASFQAIMGLLQAEKRVHFEKFQEVINPKVWEIKFERLTVSLAILRELVARDRVEQEGVFFQLV